MYCPCSTAAIVTDTGQWYRCTADITAPLSHAVLQEDDGQCGGRVADYEVISVQPNMDQTTHCVVIVVEQKVSVYVV